MAWDPCSDIPLRGSHARELALENLALRQQLAVWKAARLTEMDRVFWVVLSRLWRNWRSSLQVVRPETVVGWHRQLCHASGGHDALEERAGRGVGHYLPGNRPPVGDAAIMAPSFREGRHV